MAFFLTDEQRAIREMAQKFSNDEMLPKAAEWDEKKIFPRETLKKAAELGFAAIYVSPDHGGVGLGRLDAALIMEALAYGCPSTAAFISIHNMATWMLCTWGSNPIKDEWAQALTSGQKLSSYCLTEAEAGSDAGNLRTTAKREGDAYTLNGSKMFISGAGATELLVVMARTGTVEDGAKGISAFAVPADTPGIHYGKNETKMGWNSQPTRAITFEQTRVPAHALLGAEGEGFKIAMKGLDGGRINIAACSLGAAQATLDHAQQYMLQRKQFGKPLASFQLVQRKLADMQTEITLGLQGCLRVGRLFDEGRATPEMISLIKRNNCGKALDIARMARDMHGGNGVSDEFHVIRHVMNLEAVNTYEGTHDVHALILGRSQTGIQAFTG